MTVGTTLDEELFETADLVVPEDLLPREAPEERWTLKRTRVLVAEDDLEMRRVLIAVLRADGYEVLEAKSGVELLCCLAASALFGGAFDPPDLVISDVSMPGWTGIDFLAGLRRARRRLPVVLITAFGDEELHATALELGALAVLDKPVGLSELLDVVRSLVPSGWRWVPAGGRAPASARAAAGEPSGW